MVPMLLALAAAPSYAGDGNDVPPITSSEFRDTAHTVAPGGLVLHPFLRSTFGVADDVDVKTSFLGWIGGPNVWVEVAPVQAKSFALSIEPHARSTWGFRNYDAGADLHLTTGIGGNDLNLSAGADYWHAYAQVDKGDGSGDTVSSTASGVAIPVNVDFDLAAGERNVFRFFVSSPDIVPHGALIGSVGANWNHAFGAVRLALGVDVFVGTLSPGVADALDRAGLDVPTTAALPIPTIELWYKKPGHRKEGK